MGDKQHLVIVSNRVPSMLASPGEGDPVGGLLRAIKPIVQRQGGLWFG